MKERYTGKLRCATCGDTESLNLMMTNHISNVLNVIENILADMMNYFHTIKRRLKK